MSNSIFICLQGKHGGGSRQKERKEGGKEGRKEVRKERRKERRKEPESQEANNESKRELWERLAHKTQSERPRVQHGTC